MTIAKVVKPKSQSDIIIENAAHIYSALRSTRPGTKADLKNYVKVFLGIDVPDVRICPEHNCPMDYLWHAYSADLQTASDSYQSKIANADAVVWANRSGGKTKLAAVATLLDCLFKPGCQVRILGGSLEQSNRMYEYLVQFIYKGFEQFLAGPVRNRKSTFTNGSSVEVLTQSATSVRGTHIHKLRCDEVELFDEQVFAAAQFTTHSTAQITAALEAISTMHRPYGLMHRLVTAAGPLPRLASRDAAAGKNHTAFFKWCLWEVIEKCTDRDCSQCPLWADCSGRAKRASGYLKIDDCITQMRRSSRASWQSEMLCERPSLENVVFAEFDPAVHVAPVDYEANLPLYRSLDFGFVNPFVCLWIQVDGEGKARVIDEYVRTRASIDVHAEAVKQRTPCDEAAVAATFCDPAGAGVNDVTGTSVVKELRSLGIRARFRRSGVLEGLELIRRALRTGDGQSKLVISPRCPRLIEAMRCYHYPDAATGANRELPLKDGLYDHPIDALRYFFVNHCHKPKTTTRRY